MKKEIWIAISVGVFFAGVGVSYAIFTSTYDPTIMKFRNQDLFDQMMSNNPKMAERWMDSMMNEPMMQQQMMNQMMQNPEFMQQINNMMNSENMITGSGMTTESIMPNMKFSTNAPITIPMIDAYYNGEKVFFIHTEVSDNDMAQMMSTMINFPTLHVPDLKNMSPGEMSKVYVFTNGISGSGRYGGGPFMYQIDVFDSIPGQTGYSQLRVPYLVTWNENSTSRILTSVDEISEAESNRELTIQKTDNVVNAPVIVWKSDSIEQRASVVQRMFESMPEVDGDVTSIDIDNYLVMVKLHSKNRIEMKESEMMNP